MTEFNQSVWMLCTAIAKRMFCVAIVVIIAALTFHATRYRSWLARHRNVSITCTGGTIPVIVDNRRLGCQR